MLLKYSYNYFTKQFFNAEKIFNFFPFSKLKIGYYELIFYTNNFYNEYYKFIDYLQNYLSYEYGDYGLNLNSLSIFSKKVDINQKDICPFIIKENKLFERFYDVALDENVEDIIDYDYILYKNDILGHVIYSKSNDVDNYYIIFFDSSQQNRKKKYIITQINKNIDFLIVNNSFSKGIVDKTNKIFYEKLNLTKDEFLTQLSYVKNMFNYSYNLLDFALMQNYRYVISFYKKEKLPKIYVYHPKFNITEKQTNQDNLEDAITYQIAQEITNSIDAFAGY